jgi:flagellar basal-body rod modification protein FlgD
VTTDPLSALSTSTDPASSASTSDTTKPNSLGKDAFLQLLVTQLQHQDPLQPQDNSAFLAQLAQFTSVESLEQIKTDMSSLLGIVQSGASVASAAVTAADNAAATNTSAS